MAKKLSVVAHVFTARFTAQAWDYLKESAEASGRTLNAELMDMLDGLAKQEAKAQNRSRGKPRST